MPPVLGNGCMRLPYTSFTNRYRMTRHDRTRSCSYTSTVENCSASPSDWAAAGIANEPSCAHGITSHLLEDHTSSLAANTGDGQDAKRTRHGSIAPALLRVSLIGAKDWASLLVARVGESLGLQLGHNIRLEAADVVHREAKPLVRQTLGLAECAMEKLSLLVADDLLRLVK